MTKPLSSLSVNCFGIRWLENGKYEITREKDYFLQKLKEMKECGFDAIELGSAGPWNRQEEVEAYPFVKEAVKMIKDHGILFNSVHIPFSLSWYDISCTDEANRKHSVDCIKWAIDHYDGCMPNVFVIHPDEPPKSKEERPFKIEQLIKSAQEISEYSPVPVAIENMIADGLMNVPEEALYVLNAAPKINMTIDLNHSYYENPADYIRKIGSRVKNIHASDRDAIRERHWLPKTGILDFDDIIKALYEINYQGAFTYEVDIKGGTYTVKQVKDNYDDLFKNYGK